MGVSGSDADGAAVLAGATARNAVAPYRPEAGKAADSELLHKQTCKCHRVCYFHGSAI